MKTTDKNINTIWIEDMTAYKPTREDILNLEVGDVAPYTFGESRVTEITAKSTDINGKWFVCYYVQYGDNAQMSHSLKEGEVDRQMSLCTRFTSAQIDRFDD
jgi:hypothetical protein